MVNTKKIKLEGKMKFKEIILGSIFLLFGGIMYEIDKVLSYYKWASYITAINGSGGFIREPDKITLFDNKIAFLFFIIGVSFYVYVGLTSYKNRKFKV